MGSLFKILIALGVSLVAFATPSFAQATRTWVSGVGDDVNPCSRTAPCKTFAGAISKTAAGGEINCLDPGGYGTLTITKSITIDCTGTFGSALNSGGVNGFVINDSVSGTPNTAEVILRGIAINGAGTTPGLNGIRFLSGSSLVLEDVLIQNQLGGNGISLQPAARIEFYAENVTVTDGAGGILMQPTGANGAIRAFLRNVRVQNNSGAGLSINTTGNTAPAGIFAMVEKSVLTGNATGVALNTPVGTTSATVMLNDSVVSGNLTVGLTATGAAARIRAANSSVTSNTTGVAIAGGAIINSYGNNRLDGNGSNGAFTAPAIPQQ